MIPLQFDPEPTQPWWQEIIDSWVSAIPTTVILLLLIMALGVVIVGCFCWLWVHRILLRRRAQKIVDDGQFLVTLELRRWGIRSDSWFGRRRDGLIRWLLSADLWGYRPFAGRLTGVYGFPKDECIYVIGQTRSGKTETMKVFVYQTLPEHSDDVPSIFLEYKEDFTEMFDELEEDYIYLSPGGSTHILNLFDGIEKERDFDTVARFFFSARNPYFENAPRQVLVACMKHLYRFADDPDSLTNADLVRFVQRNSPEMLDKKFDESPYNYTTARSHLGSEGDRTGSVMSSLQSSVNDVFRGDFGASPYLEDKPSFSIADYIENPDGKHLILSLPPDEMAGTEPIFRYVIDRGIQLALKSDDPSHWFLDEFASIGGLKMIERLTNAGAGRNVQAVFGIQGASQLETAYGSEASGEAVSIGMPSQIAHSLSSDDDSAPEVRNRLQSERDERLQQSRQDVDRDDREPIPLGGRLPEEGVLTGLNPGHAAFATKDKGWFLGRVKMLSEVRWLLNRVLPDRGEPESVEEADRAEPESVEETDRPAVEGADPEPGLDPLSGPESDQQFESVEEPEPVPVPEPDEIEEPDPDDVFVEEPEPEVEPDPEPEPAEIDTSVSDAERAVAGDSKDSGETGIRGDVARAAYSVEDNWYGLPEFPDEIIVGLTAMRRANPATETPDD